MKWVLVALGVLAALVAFDRAMLAMESRGWVRWRRTKGEPSGTISSGALLDLQAFVEPKVRHVREERVNAAGKAEADDAGGPPEQG